jgi:hypothetical protein
MIIRKISVGSDYKSAMHYIVGQEVLNGNYRIHLIDYKVDTGAYVIYVESDDEVVLWKEFNANIPVSVEYNINF